MPFRHVVRRLSMALSSALALAEQHRQHPVAVGLGVAVAAGAEDVFAGTAGVFEGVGEDGEEVGAALVADGQGEVAYR
jgi:hypothetical protein